MALTKGSTVLASAVTTTSTTSAQDTSNAYAAAVVGKVVQVGTATVAATVAVQVSVDGGTDYFDLTVFAAGSAAGTYPFAVDLPDAVTNVKLGFTTQSGGTSSTLDAELGEVTAL